MDGRNQFDLSVLLTWVVAMAVVLLFWAVAIFVFKMPIQNWR